MTAQLAPADSVIAPGTLWHNAVPVDGLPPGSNARVEVVSPHGTVLVRVTHSGRVTYDAFHVSAFRARYRTPDAPWSACQLRECVARLARFLRAVACADQRRAVARFTRIESYLRGRVAR